MPSTDRPVYKRLDADTALQHLEKHRKRIETETNALPLEIFMTLSFQEPDYEMPPSFYLKAYELCYSRLLRLLIKNNFDRKKHLYPLAYAFFDLPHTSAYKNAKKDFIVEALPHIHSVLMIHPYTIDTYVAHRQVLQAEFVKALAERRANTPVLISLDEQVVDDLSKVVNYSSKLMKDVRHRDYQENPNNDLYTIQPSR